MGLNILAITFVVDLDDMAAKFFLTSHVLKKVQMFCAGVCIQADVDWKLSVASFLWNRLMSITVVILMIFNTTYGHLCSFKFHILYPVARVIFIFVHACVVSIEHKSFVDFLLDLFRSS